MRMTGLGPLPPRTPLAHACALAATCLLLGDAIARGVPVAAQTATTLEVMDWNIHHGVDTNNVNNLARVVDWIVTIDPDVVSLNEVEKQNGYNGNADEPAILEAGLESRTGVPWHGCFAQRTGATRGQGNLILSRIRIESCDTHLLSATRSVARATLVAGGVTIAVFSTHLDDGSASTRATQVSELITWAATAPAQRILMGDFNASATAAELAPLRADWDDAWLVAKAAGTAVAYAGNTAGNTRNGRIDYIWRFKGASSLSLQSARVWDSGTVSDHRPLSAIYVITAAMSSPRPPAHVRVIR